MNISPRYSCLFLFLLTLSCDDDNLFHIDCAPNTTKQCGLTNLEHLDGIGMCSFGKSHCLSGGVWSECMDERKPADEICDSRDNDCDGDVDEDFPEKYTECGHITGLDYEVGVCTPGTFKCEEGVIQCRGHEGPTDEICDGIDNNCNGEVDENLLIQTVEVCYDGPENTVFVGVCKAGVKYCAPNDSFTSDCVGQVLPSIEICDGLDNDCDGQVDEGFDSGKVDLVFIIDISGSFESQIENTIFGIEPLLSDPITSDFMFSLVLIGTDPEPDSVPPWRYLKKQTNFVNASEFLQYLHSALVQARSSNTGTEPSYDALSLIANHRFSLNYREDAHKVIILMTDETGQSYDSPPINEIQVADSFDGSNFIVHVYNHEQHRHSFDSIVRAYSNYHVLERYENPDDIFESLRRIFLNACL